MTRSAARAIALSCIYESGFHETPIEEIIEDRVGQGFLSLAGEDPLFSAPMTEKAAAYIRDVVTVCIREEEALKNQIASLSVDWNVKRISRMTMAILQLALTEIMFRDDVPVSTAINEAVNLAKKFDTEKAPAFINGILGSFAASYGDKAGKDAVTQEGE
jgi:N utilization substance protein B